MGYMARRAAGAAAIVAVLSFVGFPESPAGAQSTAITWSQPVLVHTASVGVPQLSINPADRLFVTWQDDRRSDSIASHNDTYVRSSADGGRTFGSESLVATDAVGAFIAGTGTNAYFFWCADTTTPDRFSTTLSMARSTNSGASFASPVRINPNTGNCLSPPSVARDASGNVYVLWAYLQDRLMATERSSLLFAKSTDGGNSFSSPVTIEEYPGDVVSFRGFWSDPTIQVSSNGAVYVAWSDARNPTIPGDSGGPSNVYFTRSTSGGTSFEPARRANDLPGLPPIGAGMARLAAGPDQQLYLIWHHVYEGQCPCGNEVRFTRSTNSGASFEPSRRVGDPSFLLRATISAGPSGRVLVLFDYSRNDTMPYSLLSTDGGVSFGAASQLPSGGQSVVSAFDSSGTPHAVFLGFSVWHSRGELPTPAAADLSLTKTDTPDPVSALGTLTYTLTVRNNGPSGATGVTLTDPLPAGVEFLSATTGCTPTVPPLPANREVVCSIGNLAVDGTARATIGVRPLAAGAVTNSSRVLGTQPDPDSTNNTASQVTTVTPPVAARKIVVFLAGIGTDLTQEDIAGFTGDSVFGTCSDPNRDRTFGQIKARLLENGFICADFLRYSYRGGSMSSTAWIPQPYGCDDTGQAINTSVFELHSMLRAYREANPNTQFILVGHSLGGVLALESTRFIGPGVLLPPGSVSAVITVDSPLNHATRQNLLDIRRILGATVARVACQSRIFFTSAAAVQLGDVTDNNRSRIRQQKEELVATAKSKGVRFMTIGNEQDCVWHLTLCGMRRTTPVGIALPGDWENDLDSMVIHNADLQMRYPLGTGGCDLSGTVLDLLCLPVPHGLALDSLTVANDIGGFIGRR